MKVALYLGTKAENPAAEIGDRLICWWTNSRFSHVEFVKEIFSNGVGLCWGASQREGKVRQKYIDLNSGRWLVVEIPGGEIIATYWFSDHVNLPYDWRGAIAHALPFLGQKDGAWYCSEAIAAAAGLSNTALTPQDIFDLRVTN